MHREMLLDYRDRASVLIWVVLMGLAAQRLLALPTIVVAGGVLGSPVAITVTTNTVLGLILAGLAASGAEAIVRAHPLSHSGESGPHWLAWGVPVALIGVAVFLLPVAPSRLYWLVGLILTGIALGLSLAGIYYTMDPFATGYRRARLGMNALTYGIALVLYLVVYRTRARSIVSATEIMLVSGLLALELLRGSQRPTVSVALYAVIAGAGAGAGHLGLELHAPAKPDRRPGAAADLLQRRGPVAECHPGAHRPPRRHRVRPDHHRRAGADLGVRPAGRADERMVPG